eukprot:7400642-Pyramimonas_sp.AAC.2
MVPAECDDEGERTKAEIGDDDGDVPPTQPEAKGEEEEAEEENPEVKHEGDDEGAARRRPRWRDF